MEGGLEEGSIFNTVRGLIQNLFGPPRPFPLRVIRMAVRGGQKPAEAVTCTQGESPSGSIAKNWISRRKRKADSLKAWMEPFPSLGRIITRRDKSFCTTQRRLQVDKGIWRCGRT